MLRKEAGKICGKKVATTLSRYAVPVPRPIRVNIFGLRLTSDDQKRSKKGEPPQRTTGLARDNSIQLRTSPDKCNPSFSPNIPRARTGTVKIALNQKRLRIEMYSASGVSSATM